MSQHQYSTALIVSDPQHMKRALRMAQDIGLSAEPSPTPTTRYQTWRSKFPSLVYETFFYVVHVGSNAIGLVRGCPS